MSMDYSNCEGCNCIYYDGNEGVCYCDCGNSFCSFECGKLTNHFTPEESDKVVMDEGDPRGEDIENNGNYHIDNAVKITCVICRKEVITDYVLIRGLLKHCNLTRQEAEEIIRNQED